VLGDPIEFGALKTVLAETLPKETKSIYQSLVATKVCDDFHVF
jgi:acyl transferase domain-containing protein